MCEAGQKNADTQRTRGLGTGLNHSFSFNSPLRTIMSNSPLLIGWFWYEMQAWKQPRECRVSRKNTWQVCLLDVTDFSNETPVLSSSWGPSYRRKTEHHWMHRMFPTAWQFTLYKELSYLQADLSLLIPHKTGTVRWRKDSTEVRVETRGSEGERVRMTEKEPIEEEGKLLTSWMDTL